MDHALRVQVGNALEQLAEQTLRFARPKAVALEQRPEVVFHVLEHQKGRPALAILRTALGTSDAVALDYIRVAQRAQELDFAHGSQRKLVRLRRAAPCAF